MFCPLSTHIWLLKFSMTWKTQMNTFSEKEVREPEKTIQFKVLMKWVCLILFYSLSFINCVSGWMHQWIYLGRELLTFFICNVLLIQWIYLFLPWTVKSKLQSIPMLAILMVLNTLHFLHKPKLDVMMQQKQDSEGNSFWEVDPLLKKGDKSK